MRASIVAALFLACVTASAQEKKRTGVPPVEDSLKAMKVHEGLEVTFWAGEPGLINPTDMDVDEREAEQQGDGSHEGSLDVAHPM